MNKSKYLILGLFIIVVSQAYPVDAIICKPAVQSRATKPWHVTELKQEGASLPGQGTWYFNMSWKPVLIDGKRLKTYDVAGYKCTGHKYECTDARCNAEISGCVTESTWAGVTAAFGVSASGIRLSTIFKPGVCD
jgi:hypothetical protein